MCLRQRKYAIANEDIVCYKVVKREIVNGHAAFVSPYVLTSIEQDIIEGKEPFVAKDYNKSSGWATISEKDFAKLNDRYAIGSGAIHTYSSKKAAIKERTSFRSFAGSFAGCENMCFIIFKCVIPKGTQYYYGRCDNGFMGYASRRIMFKEILN